MNTSKAEIYIFKPKLKPVTKHLKFRVSGKKINIISIVKYLGLHLYDSLTWDICYNNFLTKLIGTIGFLSKIENCAPKSLLKTIYLSLFKRLSDMRTIDDEFFSRDMKFAKQNNLHNQLFTKKSKFKRDLEQFILQNVLLMKDFFEKKSILVHK